MEFLVKSKIRKGSAAAARMEARETYRVNSTTTTNRAKAARAARGLIAKKNAKRSGQLLLPPLELQPDWEDA